MISRIDLNFIEYAFDELIKNTSFESKIKDLKEQLVITKKSMDNISNLDKINEYFLIKGQMNNARQNKKKKLQPTEGVTIQ